MKNNNDLETLIYECSYNLANKLDKNDIEKLLGILSNDGVYAMWVWAKYKLSDKKNNDEKLKDFLSEINKITNKLFNINLNIDNYEDIDNNLRKKISSNPDKLLLLKQILERTLILARYHAKAKSD